MTIEEKIKVDNSPAVCRRGIYEFIEHDGSIKNYALVVGATQRGRDRFVSIIMLKDAEAIGMSYPDSEVIPTPLGDMLVHCGMVTYARRDRLGEQIHEISKKTMRRVSAGMAKALGIVEQPVETDDADYKKLYIDLLQAISKGVAVARQEADE